MAKMTGLPHIISPCKDCGERHMKCHGTCRQYQTYHADRIAQGARRAKALAGTYSDATLRAAVKKLRKKQMGKEHYT